jgi:hypothetical protein
MKGREELHRFERWLSITFTSAHRSYVESVIDQNSFAISESMSASTASSVTYELWRLLERFV